GGLDRVHDPAVFAKRPSPEAIMAEFAGARGAFISFLGEYQELAKVKRTFNRRREFSGEELLKWQKMVIWNFLIGNLDPHDKNIFVKINAQGELVDIRMIDHGNSFPESNPGRFGSRGNLGFWRKFTISQEPFCHEIRQFILDNISEETVTKFFDANPDRSHFFKKPMRKLQQARLRLLREQVATGNISTPADLAKVQTNRDYSKLLKSRNPQECGRKMRKKASTPVQEIKV
ncbi:MAG: hypothetical protein ACE5GN_04510, partial [Waddliaceae bacterium]